MTKVTVSSKGQLTIPKAVRDQLNIKPGAPLSIDVQGDAIVITRLPDWRTMCGMFKSEISLTRALEEEHAAELAREDARLQNL